MKKTLILVLMIITMVGFDFVWPQDLPQWAQITMQNQFTYTVDFYIDGAFACRALANLFCTASVKVKSGSYRLEARDGNGTTVSSKLVESISRGDSVTWNTLDNDVSRTVAPPSASVEPPPVKIKDPGEGSTGKKPSASNGGGGNPMDNLLFILGGAALAGAGIYALTQLAEKSGCKPGYVPCGNTGKCCPEDHPWYSPSHNGCYTLYDVTGWGKIRDGISCHPATIKLKK